MRSARLTGAADMRQEGCVVTCDYEIKRDDLYAIEYALNQRAALISALVVGKLDTDQQFGRGDRADRDVSIVIGELTGADIAALKRDQRARVENQSFHGSLVGAPPTNRRRSARSLSHSASGV
jgi:hypothetical protein